MNSPSFEVAHPIAKRAAARSRSTISLRYLWVDREDLEQEAAIALWQALPHFDPSRASLRTFAEHVISRRFLSLCRTRRNRFDCLVDCHPIGADSILPLVFNIDFQRLVAQLSERDRRLAELLPEHSPTEAGRLLGISRSTVYERIRRIGAVFERFGWSPRRRSPQCN